MRGLVVRVHLRCSAAKCRRRRMPWDWAFAASVWLPTCCGCFFWRCCQVRICPSANAERQVVVTAATAAAAAAAAAAAGSSSSSNAKLLPFEIQKKAEPKSLKHNRLSVIFLGPISLSQRARGEWKVYCLLRRGVHQKCAIVLIQPKFSLICFPFAKLASLCQFFSR